MKRLIEYNISDQDIPCTVQDFLKIKGYSRKILTGFKTNGGSVLLNGLKLPFSTVLKEGDVLTIHLVDLVSSEKIPPVDLPLNVIYEDEDILVVNKPADMPVHPSQGNYENTLANAIAFYFESCGESFVFRCINRLDRDTTGVILIAKNSLSAAILSAQMKKREIHRTYLALASGHTPDYGTIDAPIGRVAGSTIERCVDFEFGESAVTHYKLIDFKNNLSLLELHLDTGRTHQIRVHMKHIGYPLIGDNLYQSDCSKMSRQALHSARLKFQHPITSEMLEFSADLPVDMKLAFYVNKY